MPEFAYFGGSGLFKLSLDDGSLVWSWHPPRPSKRFFTVGKAPIVTAGKVILRTSAGTVVSLNEEDRSVDWAWDGPPFEEPFYLPPLVHAAGLILVAYPNELVALSIDRGTLAWRVSADTAGSVSSTPASNGTVAVFCTEAGSIICVRVIDGQRMWGATPFSSLFDCDPMIVGESIFLASRAANVGPTGRVDVELACLSLKTGEVRWRERLPGSAPSACVWDHHSAVAVGSDLQVVVLDGLSGELKHKQLTTANPFSGIVIDAHEVWVGCLDGSILQAGIGSTVPTWRAQVVGGELGSITHLGTRMLLTTSAGACMLDLEERTPDAPVVRTIDLGH